MKTPDSELLNQLRKALHDMQAGKRGLLTTAEVCRLVGVSKMAVCRWAKLGTIPHFRLNGLLRFDPAQLLDWATARLMQ